MNAAPPAPIAEAGPRITATLKCYGADGANVGELLIRADGTTSIREDSERSLLCPAIDAVRGFDLRRLGNRLAK